MRRNPNGSRVNLQAAVALLLHNQAEFVSEMAESNQRWNELRAEVAQTFAAIERRFTAIEKRLDAIERALHELPEAIRQKIGFKPK